MTIWRSIRLVLILLMLAASVWLGPKEGWDHFHDAENPGQRAGTSFQALYGLFAGASLAGLLSDVVALLIGGLIGWGALAHLRVRSAPV